MHEILSICPTFFEKKKLDLTPEEKYKAFIEELKKQVSLGNDGITTSASILVGEQEFPVGTYAQGIKLGRNKSVTNDEQKVLEIDSISASFLNSVYINKIEDYYRKNKCMPNKLDGLLYNFLQDVKIGKRILSDKDMKKLLFMDPNFYNNIIDYKDQDEQKETFKERKAS